MLVSRCDGQSWRAGSRSRFSTAPHVHVIDAITVDVALQLAAAAMLEVEGVERGEHGDHRVLAGSEGPLARLNVSVILAVAPAETTTPALASTAKPI